MAGLDTHFIGRRVVYFPSNSSTMEAAREEALRGAEEGTVVIAGEQTAGKGRNKRVWLSPRGSVSLSLILRPDVSQIPCLVMLASVAVAHSIEAVTGLETQLKWPNDVLIKGRKVCGILIENVLKGKKVDYAIIGIGMNVNNRTGELSEIDDAATSLCDELGKELSRLEIIHHLLVELERLYLFLEDRDDIYKEWRCRLINIGKRVRIISDEDVLYGVARDVDRDGSLLLKRDDGSINHIVAGDVTLRDVV